MESPADVHVRQSGVADLMAENDAHAMAMTRQIVAGLNRRKHAAWDLKEPREPLYDPADIYGIVSADPKKPYDVRQIIAVSPL